MGCLKKECIFYVIVACILKEAPWIHQSKTKQLEAPFYFYGKPKKKD